MTATSATVGHESLRPAGSPIFASPEKRAVLLGLGLILGTLLLYQPALRRGFVDFDDPEYITANIPVQNGLTWKSIHWAFVSTAVSNWHPITWLSHMLD